MSKKFESNIATRPFSFSSVPPGGRNGASQAGGASGNGGAAGAARLGVAGRASSTNNAQLDPALVGQGSSKNTALAGPGSSSGGGGNLNAAQKASNSSNNTAHYTVSGLANSAQQPIGTPMSETPPNADGAGGGAGGAGEKGKGKQGGASDFVKKLYKMLEEDAYKDIVTWGSKGDSFIVKDMNEFTKTILPSHFKHSNFASFVRQLNKYDFHKVKNPEGQGEAPGENYWEFRHPSFTADQKHSLENIKRKITANKKPDTPGIGPTPSGGPSSIVVGPGGGPGSSAQTNDDINLLNRQIGALTHNQRQIEMHLDRFTAQYQALMADLLGQHRAIAAQDAFTASMLQYMINLECRLLTLSSPADGPPAFPPSSEAQQLMATYSEISRSRYDKMTETTRRAEQLGLFVNGMRRFDSPPAHHPLPPQMGGPGGGGPPSSATGPGPGGPQLQPIDTRGAPWSAGQGSAQAHQQSPLFPNKIPYARDEDDGSASFSFPRAQQQQQQPFAPARSMHQQQHSYPNTLPPMHSQAPAPPPFGMQGTPLHHPQQQAAGQQFSYFPQSQPTTHLRDNRTDSPASTSESNTSYVNPNIGEIRVSGPGTGAAADGGYGSSYGMSGGGHQMNHAQPHQPHQTSQLSKSSHLAIPTPTQQPGHYHSEPQIDYFPTPGSGPIMASSAITPGAVMISTLNTGGSYTSRETSQDDGTGEITPDSATRNSLTQLNTDSNKNLSYPLEGEDIAAFAAALKGGQSSMAVRSALTSQPLLVRRATYIPGWSVPPRVLLVEDDAVCRNLTTKFLQLFGCTIDVAADGVEAVGKMQTGVYDICMMDVSMPNLDGVSATSLIRQFDAMTPIISMTGNSRPDEILTYFSHGMNDVLPKPFTKEGMLSMLEKHLIHLKQIHQNPEMAPNPVQLENLDTDTFDPNINPFFGLGLSNDEYQNILNGLGKSGFTPSPSPITVSTHATGKRQQDEDSKEGVKRARFQEA